MFENFEGGQLMPFKACTRSDIVVEERENTFLAAHARAHRLDFSSVLTFSCLT